MNKKSFFALIFIILISVISIFNLVLKQKKTPYGTSYIQIVNSIPIRSSSLSETLNNKNPFSILLLGYGGGTHDGADLTDSMMIAYVDPSVKKVILISIPRDLYVNIPTNQNGGSYWKINAAYAIGIDDRVYTKKPNEYKGQNGSGNLAKTAVEYVTGIPIDRYFAADFNSFVTMIDAIGGLDVDMDKEYDDYMYPVDGKENDLCDKTKENLTPEEKSASLDVLPTVFPCRYEHLHINSGQVHLDGQTALKFVRSRHSADNTGDFGRSNRQRILMTALKKKVFSLTFITKIIPLYNSLKNSVYTDISIEEMKNFILSAKDFSGYDVSNIALSDENVLNFSFSTDGQYILAPKTGQDDWNSVHRWLRSEIQKAISSSNKSLK